ncbi:hypothetical protein NIES4103_14840 [Nostoc sp. NIES-4103]|nr:hypothetical protein NIES4103_14840 [Nostoc sp. NIES-4103]
MDLHLGDQRVLIMGSSGLGAAIALALAAVAENVRGTVVSGYGHFIPEERLEYLKSQLLQFLAEDYKS